MTRLFKSIGMAAAAMMFAALVGCNSSSSTPTASSCPDCAAGKACAKCGAKAECADCKAAGKMCAKCEAKKATK